MIKKEYTNIHLLRDVLSLSAASSVVGSMRYYQQMTTSRLRCCFYLRPEINQSVSFVSGVERSRRVGWNVVADAANNSSTIPKSTTIINEVLTDDYYYFK